MENAEKSDKNEKLFLSRRLSSEYLVSSRVFGIAKMFKIIIFTSYGNYNSRDELRQYSNLWQLLASCISHIPMFHLDLDKLFLLQRACADVTRNVC